MAPHDMEPAAAPAPRPDLGSPEAIRAATDDLRRLGYADERIDAFIAAGGVAPRRGSSPTDPDRLAQVTRSWNALGIEGAVVFSSGSEEELDAFLNATPCETTS